MAGMGAAHPKVQSANCEICATSKQLLFMTMAASSSVRAFAESFSVSELCDWLSDQLKDEIGEEGVEVFRKNKVC